MAILTYKEAAKALKISLNKFVLYIERTEFSSFRTEAKAHCKKSNSPIEYTISCRGIYFNDKFIKLFKKITERKKYYGN